jgi:hypothetical protein
MRGRTEFALYLLVVALFGGVVLWAEDATAPVVILFGVFVGLLAIAMVVFVTRPRTVLVVGEPSDEVERIGRALEDAGYETCTCAGPANRPCPVLRGGVCPIRERPLAALIFHPAGARGRYAPCGPALRVPAVVVEERMEAEPVVSGRFAHVGLDRGADRVVRTMDDLLAA